MIVLSCFIVCGLTAVAVAAIVTKFFPTTESEVLRTAYRNLETETRVARESAALALHNLQELRERLADQRDSDRARLARCEVQVEANERNMTKLATQFKESIVEVKQESTKLSMLAGSFQKRG